MPQNRQLEDDDAHGVDVRLLGAPPSATVPQISQLFRSFPQQLEVVRVLTACGGVLGGEPKLVNAKVCDLESPPGGYDTVGAPEVAVHAQV